MGFGFCFVFAGIVRSFHMLMILQIFMKRGEEFST